MLKMNFRRVFGLALAIFVAGSLTVGCYDDSELRASLDDLKTQLSQLKTLVSTLQNDDAVTGVTQNPDGSYTITFKKSGAVTIKNGTDGKPGKDGKDGSIVNVTKDNANHTYVFSFSDGTTLVLPQYSETRVLTFEDKDYKGPVETTSYWTTLIDFPQYGGPLLYGDGCTWTDDQNTFLSGGVDPYNAATYSGGFSGGGIAISNYGSCGDADYTRQLEVWNASPVIVRTGTGAGGSDNFAVCYDASPWGKKPELTMADKEPRTVVSAMVNITDYTCNVLVNGNSSCVPLASNGFFKVTATGYLNGEVTGTSDFYLAKDGFVFTEWRKWDLSGLGSVDKIDFAVSGSEELYGAWGFNAPAYFALDNITVVVYP